MEHAPAPVSADDLATTLEHMREQQAQFHAVERPAATGDLVVVDYTIAIDGHPASSQTGYEFLVGAGNVLPEIDDAVVGVRAGGRGHWSTPWAWRELLARPLAVLDVLMHRKPVAPAATSLTG